MHHRWSADIKSQVSPLCSWRAALQRGDVATNSCRWLQLDNDQQNLLRCDMYWHVFFVALMFIVNIILILINIDSNYIYEYLLIWLLILYWLLICNSRRVMLYINIHKNTRFENKLAAPVTFASDQAFSVSEDYIRPDLVLDLACLPYLLSWNNPGPKALWSISRLPSAISVSNFSPLVFEFVRLHWVPNWTLL